MSSDGPEIFEGPVLAIATGHELSVVLFEGNEVLGARHLATRRGYAEALMSLVAEVLQDCRPVKILVEVGPGSFTGLRVGIAAARGLALAWDIPIYGMRSTLMVAAEMRAAGNQGLLQVALAAPRGQLWVEHFAANGLESAKAPYVVPARQQPEPYGEMISDLPHAAMARHIPVNHLQDVTPLYVREEDGSPV